MECIPTIVSETIEEETVYANRHEDFEEKKSSAKRMARTKRTLNQRQYDIFVQQGFCEAIQRQVQNEKLAHPWSDQDIYNYIIKNRHKIRNKANKMSDWPPVNNLEFQPVKVVMAVDKDHPSLTDSGQEPLH